ncbi:MAG: carboxypeptidase-like regulatory domain-containing protein, partial [candidate division KSB1 bacterium]|nr:carboxypeptidase-like regulatory domain-containing protein [candidate division KSB1 bacterium]
MISNDRQIFLLLWVCLIVAFPGRQHASPSGTVSGYVRDQETGYPLPGASILVEGTTFGAMADKNGHYIIYNLPPGQYNLRATMIGYVPTKITSVQVKTDLNTPIDFSLVPQVLLVPQEIVITAPRIEIYKDVVSSLHYLGEEQLAMALPAQNFQEALTLVPGFVANHFRGGRPSNALYLIDGLPASGPLTRDLAFMVQNTAIAEMVIQTGGFSPEYGNVSAGLVNLITKEGRNHFHGMAKVATDVVGQYDNRAFDNSRRAELTIGGPLTLGLGGPVVETNYLISGGVNFTDTPHREAMRQAFNSPVVFNYDLNTKLAIRAHRNLYLRWQALLSDWDWRQYDRQWDDRLSALPKRRNRNVRLSLSLTHTLSPAMFYKLDLVSLDLRRNVFGEVQSGAPSNLALKHRSLASAWPGATEPWFEQRREKQYTAHLSLIRQLTSAQQIKAGLESNWWDLQLDRSRYLLWPALGQESEFVYSRYDDSFRQFPYTVASYFQYKIDLTKVIFNLGGRYELFSPNASQAPLPTESPEVDSAAFRETKSHVKQTLAPRISLAIPISKVEHLSFNYG